MFNDLPDHHVTKLMHSDLFFLKKKNKEQIERIISDWLQELLFCDLKLEGDENNSFLFLRTLIRDDYRDLFHTIIQQCPNNKNVVEDFIQKSTRVNLDASTFLSNNRHLVQYFSDYGKGFTTALTIRFIYYCYIVSKLLVYKPEVFVCFADMQPIDYLASICFKKLGAKTVTLQHGLYIDYGNLDTVNTINYLNQPSDYFLAWGDNTKNLIEKYHQRSNVVICGKPTLCEIDKSEGSTILVIFDQEIFHNENVEMYKIAESVASQLGFEVFVRFHPHNNVPAYQKKLSNLKVDTHLENHKFIVGHTSSLLYEMQACGKYVVQYRSNIPTIDIDDRLQFQSSHELKGIFLNTTKPLDTNGSQLINYISNQSKRQYRYFFESVCPTESKTPFFSVIIPCFNSQMTISKSIDSLKEQSFKDFEVLIMDGLSDDATIPFAISYIGADERFEVYSSRDLGTYDAMNKGLDKAKGRMVYFMGSDDCFSDSNVLKDVYQKIQENNCSKLGMLYGNVQVVGDVKWAKNGTIYDGKFDNEKIKKKNICHQAIFYNRSEKLKHAPYNLKYRLCADWDMNLKVWASSETIYYERTIANFFAGGQSTDGSDPAFGKDFTNNIEKYFADSTE